MASGEVEGSDGEVSEGGHDSSALIGCGELYGRLGRTDEAVRYLALLHAAHRPKRNFMAELNSRGL
jgi:hypothetical protein